MASQSKATDWLSIEKHYRAGIRSLADIGAEFGVTKGRISQVAKAKEWPRDLAKAVAAKADAKVNKAALNAELNAKQSKATEHAVIEANAELQYRVRMDARADVVRLEILVRRLISELEAETNDPDLFSKLGELLDESGPDENGRWKQDKRNELYMKVISAAWRIDAAKKLVEMTEKLIKMKFEVFGVTAAQGESSPLDEVLKKLAKERAA
jgi:hypothetical protein